MSRRRRAILFLILTLTFVTCGTAVSQLSAHWHGGDQAVECRALNLFVREDDLTDGASQTLPQLQDGDILITFSTHSFGWRHGHAGLVVDAKQGQVLEAFLLGEPSSVRSVEHWKYYSTLTVLRLKDTDPEIAKEAVAYALESLNGIPYHLTSGLWGEPDPEKLSAQCAYLVWCAYAHCGFDLDSDGGKLVTVADLAGSPLLERISP